MIGMAAQFAIRIDRVSLEALCCVRLEARS
jgi:hypothetical protein